MEGSGRVEVDGGWKGGGGWRVEVEGWRWMNEGRGEMGYKLEK